MSQHRYYTPTPALATINSNASLHNFIELCRWRDTSHSGVARDTGAARTLLRLESRYATYSLHPSPAAGAGNLTDGLPMWNMGGPLTNLQAAWPPSAAATTTVRIEVTLAVPVSVCAAKLFALRDDNGASPASMPSSAIVTVGTTTLRMTPTTSQDKMINVLYAVSPSGECVEASTVVFELTSQSGRGVAVSEVEVYSG